MNDKRLKFVNLFMGKINSLSDDLYESLMDKEDKNAIDTSNNIIQLLSDLKSTLRDEI